MLDQALAVAQTAPEAGRRARLLTTLAPRLPTSTQAGVLDQALAAVQTAPEAGRRARLLTAPAPRLPTSTQAGMRAQALAAAQAAPAAGWRAQLLTTLAPHLARHATRADFLRTLRVLAARGRPDMLSDLTALLPWLVAITTEAERAAIAQAVIDVGRCWP